MKRVLVLVLFLALVACALVAAGKNRDVIDPFLRAYGINPQSEWFEQAMRFVFTIVIGAPLAALLWTLMAMGQNRTDKDIHGYTILRLKTGMRVTLPLLSLGLAVLMFYGSGEIDGVVAQIFVQSFGVLFLWAGWVVLSARIKFDGMTLMAPNIFTRMISHDWADLDEIRTLRDSREYLLVFRDGRKVKISFFYSGVDQLIWLANQKRQANARAA
ncbi:MAG: hypothetical protein HKP29_08625 [Silicimonas sp.]|nr:hypothetical protein [Silicimonas sp.]NNL73413.1 hypothetical protein [Silicimonas sp.]